jgi:hypothetical protein
VTAVGWGVDDRIGLQDFRIWDAYIQGVGSGTASVLEACGYVTAADFTGGGIHRVWNGYGHVKIAYLTKPDGTEWKLPELGPIRVAALLAWHSAVSEIVRHGPSKMALKLRKQGENAMTFANSQLDELRAIEGLHTLESAEETMSFFAAVDEVVVSLELGRRELKRVATRLKTNAAADPFVAGYLADFLERQRVYEHLARLNEKNLRDTIRAARRGLRTHKWDDS